MRTTCLRESLEVGCGWGWGVWEWNEEGGGRGESQVLLTNAKLINTSCAYSSSRCANGFYVRKD